MEKPIISPSFSVEDIGKLREWNYERTLHMTNEERIMDIRSRAEEFFKLMENSRSRVKTELKKPETI